MKKSEVLEFFKRGCLFSGLGAITVGFVLWMVSLGVNDFHLEGYQIFLAILSGSILAFVQAGTTVFHEIERWSPLKGAGLQLLFLYLTYLSVYLINNWIPFDYMVILIFTAIIIITYALIWIIVYSIVNTTSNKLNKTIR